MPIFSSKSNRSGPWDVKNLPEIMIYSKNVLKMSNLEALLLLLKIQTVIHFI